MVIVALLVPVVIHVAIRPTAAASVASVLKVIVPVGASAFRACFPVVVNNVVCFDAPAIVGVSNVATIVSATVPVSIDYGSDISNVAITAILVVVFADSCFSDVATAVPVAVVDVAVDAIVVLAFGFNVSALSVPLMLSFLLMLLSMLLCLN